MKENKRGSSEIIKKIQAKKAFKISNGPFHALAQDTMEAIFLVKDGICLEANQTVADMFGFSIANINKTLFAISNAVNTTLDLKDLYKQIHILVSKILDVTNFYIAIVNHEKRKIRFPYHADQED